MIDLILKSSIQKEEEEGEEEEVILYPERLFWLWQSPGTARWRLRCRI